MDAAIAEYEIPLPAYVIGDVGSTIYWRDGGRWAPWTQWNEAIAPCWNGYTGPQLAGLFEDLEELRLQEPDKQNTYKLSYTRRPTSTGSPCCRKCSAVWPTGECGPV